MKRFIALALLFIYCLPGFAQISNGSGPGLGWNNNGTLAPNNAPYIVTGLQDTLDSERVLAVGTNLTLTDGGANGPITISLGTVALNQGGTGATTAAGALINLIGTPTKGKILVGNGTTWTVVSVGSDGKVLTANSSANEGVSWESTSLGSSSEPYVVMSLSGALSGERVLAAGTGLSLTDGGANGNATLAIDTAVVATLTGSQTLTNKTLTSPVINTSIVFNGTGSNDYTITFSDPASARSVNFPDLGNGDVVLTVGAQTLDGVKTFSSAPSLSTNTLTANGSTMTFPSSAQTLLGRTSTDTVTNKTFTDDIYDSSIILKQTSNNITLTWSNPSAARAYSFADIGTDGVIVLRSTSSPTAYGAAFWDSTGKYIKSTSQPPAGYVFTGNGASDPTFQPPASGAAGLCGGYLTLETGVAGSTSDQTAKSTVYFTPDYSAPSPGIIDLYNGSSNVRCTFTEISASVTSLTTDKNVDVYVYDSNADNVADTLDLVEWTNDSTRATALATQANIGYVKTGATGRRFVGTIRTYTSSGTKAIDSAEKRFVWNLYNAKPRSLVRIDTTDNWTYTSNTLHQANASTSNQVAIVCGVAGRYIELQATSVGSNGSANDYIGTGIGIDSTSTNSAQVIAWAFAPTAGGYSFARANLTTAPAAGYHYFPWLENTYRTTGTSTFLGDNNNAEIAKGQTGIIGVTWQ